MQNNSKVFKPNSNYNKRVAHQKLHYRYILGFSYNSIFGWWTLFRFLYMNRIQIKDVITNIEVYPKLIDIFQF